MIFLTSLLVIWIRWSESVRWIVSGPPILPPSPLFTVYPTCNSFWKSLWSHYRPPFLPPLLSTNSLCTEYPILKIVENTRISMYTFLTRRKTLQIHNLTQESRIEVSQVLYIPGTKIHPMDFTKYQSIHRRLVNSYSEYSYFTSPLHTNTSPPSFLTSRRFIESLLYRREYYFDNLIVYYLRK